MECNEYSTAAGNYTDFIQPINTGDQANWGMDITYWYPWVYDWSRFNGCHCNCDCCNPKVVCPTCSGEGKVRKGTQ